ncbi:MAG: nucleoside-diphosphate kinase [Candidatus Dojkabacteria bacterium]
MGNYPSIEKTFVLIKPDGIKRGLVGEIFHRFERVGLKLVASRMIKATEEQARNNYPGTEEWLIKMGEKTWANYDGNEAAIKNDLGTLDKKEIGLKIYDALVCYLTSGPVILSVWEGNHAVRVVQKLIGSTDPSSADIGTIRGDYGFDTPQLAVKAGRITFQNLIHKSDSVEEAVREIKHWFGTKFKDLSNYNRTDHVGYFQS